MSSHEPVLARRAPYPRRGLTAALALLGALVPAAVLAATARAPLPLAAVPAVTFGVPAMTAPALYVALTLVGDVAPMIAVAGAIGRGLLALALVQLGLAAPLGFLVATASPGTAVALVSGATALACGVAAVTIDGALSPPPHRAPLARAAVLWAWLGATALIAARLFADVVAEVTP